MSWLGNFIGQIITFPVKVAGDVVGNALGVGDVGTQLSNAITGANSRTDAQNAANLAYQGSKYAADQSYQGQIAANQTNIDIANATNATNIQLQREINKANLQLAQQQNDWNLAQWKRENEYNSPKHQMDLYKAAGLNPVLAQGSFSPAQQLQSADLANQVAPQATAVPTVQNASGLSSQIQAQGVMAASDIMKNQALNTAATMKASSEAHKASVEAGVIPKMTDAQVKKVFSDIALNTANEERIRTLMPYETMNMIQQYYTALANAELLKENKSLVREQAIAQKNMNSLFAAQKSALEQIPHAELAKTINEIALTLQKTHAERLANEFREKHGADYGSYASMYSANKQYELGMNGLSQNESQFKRNLRQQWSMFQDEWNIRQVLAHNQNLTSIQTATLMAGASLVNNVMNNVTMGLDSKRRYQASKTGMWSFVQDPASAYNGYYTTFGVPPIK